MNTNNQMFVQRICLGLIFSFWGIRLSLKLVTKPPPIINNGNIHGTLNIKKEAIIETNIITCVIKLLMEILKVLIAAYTKKPIAIGSINFKTPDVKLPEGNKVSKNEKLPIKMQAGSNQIKRVRTASEMPPLLYPISVRVCVLDAPGSIWQKELYSINSDSVMSRRLLTKVFNIIPRWPCGPPNAVIL